MILDASIIVEIVLKDPREGWIQSALASFTHETLRMSWVNIAEAGMTLGRSNPALIQTLAQHLLQAGIEPLTLDREIVHLAIAARSRFSLNFGDCFAYAHAKQRGETLITLDADFLKADLVRVLHPSRA